MVADELFVELVNIFFFKEKKLLCGNEGEIQSRNARRWSFRNHLNSLKHLNRRNFLACYCFMRGTVASMLQSLQVEKANNQGLPLSPMLELLVAQQFYGVGTF